MAKKKLADTTTKRGLGAIVERMDDNFKIILEATAPIPKMQEQIDHILTWEKNVNMIPAVVKQVSNLTEKTDQILTWEENVNLIPTIFEEVGVLPTELEELKREFEKSGKNDHRLEMFEKRLAKVEAKISG